MNKKMRVAAWVVLASLMLGSAGCALLGTAIGLGAAYGISQAFKD